MSGYIYTALDNAKQCLLEFGLRVNLTQPNWLVRSRLLKPFIRIILTISSIDVRLKLGNPKRLH